MEEYFIDANSHTTFFNMLFKRFVSTTKQSVADIVIIGGGPAGLTLASALKNSKILNKYKTILVEGSNLVEPLNEFQTNPPKNFMNRVVSVTPTSIDFLKKIGAWQHVKIDRTQNYNTIKTYDGVSGAELEMDSDDLATMIENFNIQSGVYQRVLELNKENPSNELDIIDKTKVLSIDKDENSEWPVVHLENGDSIKTRLLIGCDGNNSPVRKFAQIESRGWAYNRWGIVGTVKYKDDNVFRDATGWQRFLPTGTFALLPMPNNWCSFVWAVPPELSNVLMKLNDDKFLAMMNAAQKLSTDELDYLYDLAREDSPELIDEVNWRLSEFNKTLKNPDSFPVELESIIPNCRGKFPLKLTHADCYVDERVALVGDAAHTTNPLAGQGLNMGQGDAMSLIETLEKSTERGLDIGNRMSLEPYFSDRYLPNHVLLGVVDKIHKIHSTDFPPIVWARSLGVNAINNLPFVKDLLVDAISHNKGK